MLGWKSQFVPVPYLKLYTGPYLNLLWKICLRKRTETFDAVFSACQLNCWNVNKINDQLPCPCKRSAVQLAPIGSLGASVLHWPFVLSGNHRVGRLMRSMPTTNFVPWYGRESGNVGERIHYRTLFIYQRRASNNHLNEKHCLFRHFPPRLR